MPLKPSARAEACRLLSVAYELAQEALLQGNSEDQPDRWRAVANAAGKAFCGAAAGWTEAMEESLKRGRGK